MMRDIIERLDDLCEAAASKKITKAQERVLADYDRARKENMVFDRDFPVGRTAAWKKAYAELRKQGVLAVSQYGSVDRPKAASTPISATAPAPSSKVEAIRAALDPGKFDAVMKPLDELERLVRMNSRDLRALSPEDREELRDKAELVAKKYGTAAKRADFIATRQFR